LASAGDIETFYWIDGDLGYAVTGGVTCTGIIITTAGTFSGSRQPGVLSFAKIGGRWEKVQ